MKLWYASLYGLIFFWSLVSEAAEVTELRLTKPRDLQAPSYLYFTGLLEKALRKAANGREVPQLVTTIEMAEDRMLRELRAGRRIDIFWFGGTEERARGLIMVPVPLERGLMGYRKFIIRKERVAEFDAIKSLGDISQLKACQGAQWSDTDIMHAASLRLVTSVNYESLFKQLDAGRCDYFSRGIHQGEKELLQRAEAYPDLMVYEPLILHYPLGSHFFVHSKNKALAVWLQEGLEKMIDDGELIAYLKEHEYTSGAFPLVDDNVSQLLMVSNPYLPSSSDEKNPRYWFQPSDFASSASFHVRD